MFKDNINRFIKSKGLNQVTLAQKMNYSTRQQLNNELSRKLWPNWKLKKLFAKICDEPVRFGWKSAATGEIIYTERIDDLIGPWTDLTSSELGRQVGITKVRIYNKLKENQFRKDEMIRIGAALGYQMLMCDIDGNVLYEFSETDLNSRISAADDTAWAKEKDSD